MKNKDPKTKNEDLTFIVSIIVVVAVVLALLIFVGFLLSFVWTYLYWILGILVILFLASLLLLREPKARD